MKKKSTSKSAFFNFRVLIASVLCLFGVFVALLASGAFSNLFAQTKGPKQARRYTTRRARHTDTEGHANDRSRGIKRGPARPASRAARSENFPSTTEA